MTTADVVFGIGALAVLAAHVWLTVKVARHPLYDRSQKLLQAKLIWLLPVIGAVLVYSLMPEDDDQRPPTSQMRG